MNPQPTDGIEDTTEALEAKSAAVQVAVARQQSELEARLHQLIDELEDLNSREQLLLKALETRGSPVDPAAGLKQQRDQALAEIERLRSRLLELEQAPPTAQDWADNERELNSRRLELKEDHRRVVKQAQSVHERERLLNNQIEQAQLQLQQQEAKLQDLEGQLNEKRKLLELTEAEMQEQLNKLHEREGLLQREKDHVAEETMRLARMRDSVDGLTGLYLRNVFLVLAEEHFKLAKRTSRPFVLFFIDLDNLKTINDAHGHAEGDRALCETVKLMRGTFRDSDIIARVGGDEFVVLAVEASTPQIGTLLRRLYANLADYNKRRTHAYELSFSIGYAQYESAQPPEALDSLISAADKRMYEHKRSKQRALKHATRAPAETPRIGRFLAR